MNLQSITITMSSLSKCTTGFNCFFFLVLTYLHKRVASHIFSYQILVVHHKIPLTIDSRSPYILDALRKNKSVTMNTLHDICIMLDCPIEGIVKFVKDSE